ncbi:MAG TPA: pyrroloquinoline-quinone synthase PqqC [Gemmatimonadaceae bacterium]|nr:pyrroloquinoline-quinone synthase PqqC [Gemmatimonadaceae bacterium]
MSLLMTASALAPSALAAPPMPPFPRLDRPLTPDELESALHGFHAAYHVQHPFHRMMHEGTLTRRQLQGWVANRLVYQRAIPRKDGAILSNCPLPEIRRRWIQRIVDHDGVEEGTGGIALWIRLGEALGVPREEMEDERHVLPAVRMAAESYVTFCRTHSWVESVASSLTELFAPDIMHRRLAAFPAHYPWVDADALAYFRGRLVQAPRDSRQAMDIVRRFCTTTDTQRQAFEALAFKITMLWVLVDAIHNAYREE